MSEPEVIVVGGGPAGSSAAHFLARSGIEVLVLDRAIFPRDKPCSEYLSPQASRILADMKALDAVEASGAEHLAGMRVTAPGGTTIHGQFEAAHGFRGYRDRGVAVRRTILDAILLDAARDAGASVEEGVQVRDVSRNERGRVDGVITMGANGTSVTRHAKLVIGADGLRSVVGRRLGLIRTSRWPRRIALVTHFSGVRRLGEFGEMHVDRAGYCGMANVGGGLTNFSLVIPVTRAADVSHDQNEFLESWIAERPRLAEILEGAERVEPVRATGPFATYTRNSWTPGAALVGDAAEFFDPFTGEGIYTALRGGEILASYAAGAARAQSSGDADAALREYERARRREFSGKWMVEKLIGAAIALPAFMNHAARVLSERRDMADLLVGVVGDFVPAREVLRPGYRLPLLFSSPGGA
jgi:flavin-dependent dehydrogenase